MYVDLPGIQLCCKYRFRGCFMVNKSFTLFEKNLFRIKIESLTKCKDLHCIDQTHCISGQLHALIQMQVCMMLLMQLINFKWREVPMKKLLIYSNQMTRNTNAKMIAHLPSFRARSNCRAHSKWIQSGNAWSFPLFSFHFLMDRNQNLLLFWSDF